MINPFDIMVESLKEELEAVLSNPRNKGIKIPVPALSDLKKRK